MNEPQALFYLRSLTFKWTAGWVAPAPSTSGAGGAVGLEPGPLSLGCGKARAKAWGSQLLSVGSPAWAPVRKNLRMWGSCSTGGHFLLRVEVSSPCKQELRQRRRQGRADSRHGL